MYVHHPVQVVNQAFGGHLAHFSTRVVDGGQVWLDHQRDGVIIKPHYSNILGNGKTSLLQGTHADGGAEGLTSFSALKATVEKNKDTTYVNSLSRRPAATTRPQPPVDLGTSGEVKWYDAAYVPKGWHPINVPGYWEDQGVKDLNGVVWYRKEITIPASMNGKPARAFLGRIVDADELYINGKSVGRTTYQYPQRRYNVPADLLKPGKNVFVVRVTNTAGKGGFVPDKPYYVFAGADTVDLKRPWQYKVGTVYKPITGGGFSGGIAAQNQPTALYNAMVAPEVGYALKGFCWYQGESNAGRPQEYTALMPALINDWRTRWKQSTLPFLYVQLPGFMDYTYLPAESGWAILREAQLKALSVPNTAMVVAIDLGEWNDIHPDNKKAVGDRLALAAFKTAYHENLVSSGPLYQSAAIEGSKIVVNFTNEGGGLMANDGEPLSEFAIAGSDKKFVWANAKIEGGKVVVWSDEVTAPSMYAMPGPITPLTPICITKRACPPHLFEQTNRSLTDRKWQKRPFATWLNELISGRFLDNDHPCAVTMQSIEIG